jgi:hypothetical protein
MWGAAWEPTSLGSNPVSALAALTQDCLNWVTLSPGPLSVPRRPGEQDRRAAGQRRRQDREHRRHVQGLGHDPPQHGDHARRRDVRRRRRLGGLARNDQACVHRQL